MPSWNEVRAALQQRRTPQGVTDFDGFRREQYARVEQHTGRPFLVYATDFLTRAKVQASGGEVEIDMADRDGFVEITRGLNVRQADVMIYSPGGLPEAADSIVHILRRKFDTLRFIVPSLAKSAATMIVMAGDEILMEENAELGPIDPQFRMVKADGAVITAPAQAIIDQFEKAQQLVGADPKRLAAWIPILQQYGPALYQQSLNAIDLSKDYVRQWLKTWMFKDRPNRARLAKRVVDYLGDHNRFKTHGARIGIDELRRVRVRVTALNDDPELHERVMAAFHAVTLTFDGTGAFKLFENSRGAAWIRLVQAQQMVLPLQALQRLQQLQPGGPGHQPPGQGQPGTPQAPPVQGQP
jgi:hypothetical protein